MHVYIVLPVKLSLLHGCSRNLFGGHSLCLSLIPLLLFLFLPPFFASFLLFSPEKIQLGRLGERSKHRDGAPTANTF